MNCRPLFLLWIFYCILFMKEGLSFWFLLQVLYKGQEKSTSFIFQQILDLSRLQPIKKNNHSPLILGEGKDGVSSLRPCASEKFAQSLNQHLQHSEDRGTDLQQRDSLLQELKMTSFTQLENFPLSSPILLPFHGESLWHCKSPAESSQVFQSTIRHKSLLSCDIYLFFALGIAWSCGSENRRHELEIFLIAKLAVFIKWIMGPKTELYFMYWCSYSFFFSKGLQHPLLLIC